MSSVDNKVEWCLRKAQEELKRSNKHRGLVKIKPDLELARMHINKAEHNLKAIIDFKKTGYSDWSASAAFYSIYHCFLAIIAKFGYESRNQECTFALIRELIRNKKIGIDEAAVDEIHSLDVAEAHEATTVIEIRETEQYGFKTTLEDETFNKLLNTARIILDKTKEEMQKGI
jgi:uncharacterized protein (UPF0332 family)